jgi:hypothetical protein
MPTRPTTIDVSRFVAIAVITGASWLSGGGRLSAAPPPHDPTIVVTTAAELEAALSPSNAGASILVRAGEYEFGHALTVPDGALLLGEGVMVFDEAGLPTGFEASGRTLLRATAPLAGDVVTLGDGAAMRGLVIEDVAGRPAGGNPVAVVSRGAGDAVSATIQECEIVNPNPPGVTPQGPAGRGLAVVTRNPNLGQDPPPHEGTVLSVKMTDSILRSPGAGIGVFAINFASGSEIHVDLENNVVGGGLSASGGVGRPDAVTGAGVIIQSTGNLYRSDSPGPADIGWTLFGGADAPSPAFVSRASTFNSLQIHSSGDRIEGFATGIAAAGGRRFGALSEPISSNRVDLNLQGTLLQTTAADLTLFGALSLVDVSTGDDNVAHAVVNQAAGSGPRANQYAHSSTPSMGNLGVGNRLEIVGSTMAFARTNTDFVPSPPKEFFTGGN